LTTDKPDPVSNLTAKDITPNSLKLTWSAPVSDGGCDITGYVVEKREGNRRIWQSVGTATATEIDVQGLFEGNQYNFRVIAENVVGGSEPVELSDMVTAKNQFGESSISRNNQPFWFNKIKWYYKITWYYKINKRYRYYRFNTLKTVANNAFYM